jgi:photosystem I P700 chlorophyll a apoprotein A1
MSKGPVCTTWIFNLHSEPHNFHEQDSVTTAGSIGGSSWGPKTLYRKVISTGIIHIAVIYVWLGGMAFHGAYFSNYTAWLKDPCGVIPSAQIVSSIVGQDILNGQVGGSYSAVKAGSGLFYMWRSMGVLSISNLKLVAGGGLLSAVLSVLGGYYHLHVSWSNRFSLLGTLNFANGGYRNFNKSTGGAAILILVGVGSLLWSGHEYHVSVPAQKILAAHCIDTEMSGTLWVGSINNQQSLIGVASERTMIDETGAIRPEIIAAHHKHLGIVLIMLSGGATGGTGGAQGKGLAAKKSRAAGKALGLMFDSSGINCGTHAILSINLAIIGSLSIIFSQMVSSMPAYPFVGGDYLTTNSLYTHHMWIGALFIVGAAAHAGIFAILNNTRSITLLQIIAQRDIITGHLVWVTIFLGMHSFGLFVHNDTVQSLGNAASMFGDNSIALTPGIAKYFLSGDDGARLYTIEGKIVASSYDLGTTDFMVHHVHAFTIHVSVLIMIKGVLFSRSSRLVSDKYSLGFRYPCDGPGRGGTCQISPWDHIFLAVFWAYNSISVVIFHYLWKSTSDILGTYNADTGVLSHTGASDFSSNANSINGWLRNFLWSKISGLIQGYGSYVAGLTILFLVAHFVWALSLMFLFSGRGYWQEFIESIVWAHCKLGLAPLIQVRALSITQGR